MDPLIQTTIQSLQGTLNADQNIRKAAEDQLEKLRSVAGIPQILLRIIASNEIEVNIKLAGSVYLKNMTVQKWKRWREEGDTEPIMNDQDALFIKENILEAHVHCHHLIKNQIQQMIEIIASRDFPENWPKLLEQSIEYIKSKNDVYVMTGLTAIQVSVKRFQFIPEGEKRKPLNQIAERIVPLVLEIIGALSGVAPGPTTNDAAIMQRRILKIFFYTFNFDIPPIILDANIFASWMTHLLRIVAIPNESFSSANASKDEVLRNPWWILKNTTGRVLTTLLRKSGYIRKADSDSKRKLSALFKPTYAIKTMEAFYNVLKLRAMNPGHQFHNRYLQYVIEYFTLSISYGALFPAMKQVLPSLIQELLFPLVCFTDSDMEDWQDDPHQYLNDQFDMMKEYFSPRIEVHNFYLCLVEKRGREHLDSIIGWCIQILSKYLSLPADKRNPYEKYGAFSIIGTLANYLKSINVYKSNLDTMLIMHVFPELQSQHGYLRGQACWVFSQFYNIEFKEPTNFSNALKLTLMLMGDSELPVRIRAGISICNLVRSSQGTEELRPILPQLLDRIFSLMGEIDNEDLISTVDSIIRRFKYEIGPYAISLAQKLAESYVRLLDGEEDDDASSLAAQTTLSTFQTLTRSLAEVPQLFASLEPFAHAILIKTIVPEHLLFLEESLRILTFFTFYPKKISPALWQLFPMIIDMFNDSGFDLIENIVNPLDNYISYGTEHFLQGTAKVDIGNGVLISNHLFGILRMYTQLIDDIRVPSYEGRQGCKIMEAVLLRCRGHIDAIIPIVMESTCKRLLNTDKKNDMSKEFIVQLLEIVSCCLYYNPTIVIDYMTRNNLIEPVFSKWFSAASLFQRYYDKKIAVLGLSALFNIQPSPAFVQNGAKVLITNILEMEKGILRVEKEIDEEVKKEEAANGNKPPSDTDYIDDEDDDEDDEFDQMPMGDNGEFEFHTVADDQDADDPEETYLRELEKMTVFVEEDDGIEVALDDDDGSEAEIEGDAGEDGDEEELFEDDDSGGSFESPVDDVDELEFMLNSIQLFIKLNPTLLQASLTEKQQAKMQKYLTYMPMRKAKDQENKKKDQEFNRIRLEKIQELHRRGSNNL